MGLNALRDKFKAIDLISLVDECIIETEDILVKLIREQIEEGKSGDKLMPRYVSDKYAALKQKRGSKAPFGVVDLKYSGLFLDSLKLKQFKKNILIRSIDKKASLIHKKYGFDFYKLSNDNLIYYVNEVIQPLLLKKIRR